MRGPGYFQQALVRDDRQVHPMAKPKDLKKSGSEVDLLRVARVAERSRFLEPWFDEGGIDRRC